MGKTVMQETGEWLRARADALKSEAEKDATSQPWVNHVRTMVADEFDGLADHILSQLASRGLHIPDVAVK